MVETQSSDYRSPTLSPKDSFSRTTEQKEHQEHSTVSAGSSTFTDIQQEIAAPTTSQEVRVINEKPVLERVEKIQHTDVHKRLHIHEKHIQDVIEIREIPTIKKFVHPVQQVKIVDDPLVEVEGKEEAEMELQRILEELRQKDMKRKIEVDQREDVIVHNHEPTKDVDRQVVKHVIVSKPVITEIHEQPIEEIREQIVQRIIYEKPVLRIIRSEKTITEVIEKKNELDITEMHIKEMPAVGNEMENADEKVVEVDIESIKISSPTAVLNKEDAKAMLDQAIKQSLQTEIETSASSSSNAEKNVEMETLKESPETPSLLGTIFVPVSSSASSTSTSRIPEQQKKGIPKMGFGKNVTEELGAMLAKRKDKAL